MSAKKTSMSLFGFGLIKCCMRPNKINRASSSDHDVPCTKTVNIDLNTEPDENTEGRVNDTNNTNTNDIYKTITEEQATKIREIIGESITKTIYEEEECKPIQWADTVPFTFPITEGQVIKVYDGDTITIASKLPYPESPLYRLSVRLNGIDTPEIKGKNDDEKEAAKNARDAVSNMIMQKRIRLENVQSEKYGRILADVYFGDIHLNQWLIDNRYAVSYDGGTKVAPTSWLKYKESGVV